MMGCSSYFPEKGKEKIFVIFRKIWYELYLTIMYVFEHFSSYLSFAFLLDFFFSHCSDFDFIVDDESWRKNSVNCFVLLKFSIKLNCRYPQIVDIVVNVKRIF